MGILEDEEDKVLPEDHPAEPAAIEKEAGEPAPETALVPEPDKRHGYGRSRRKSSGQKEGSGARRIVLAVAALLAVILVAGGAVYAYMGQQYRSVFFPNTVINGLEASGKTVDQVKTMIASGIEGYTLTLQTRGGGQEEIAGTDISLHSEYDGTLESVLAAQNPLYWGSHTRKSSEYEISAMIAYDQELLEQKLKGMDCLNQEKMKMPVNAGLSDYIEGTGYQIVPEDQGNFLIYDKVLQGVTEAIAGLKSTVSLEELDAYEKPAVTAADAGLADRAAQWNRYAGVKVTYQFGGSTETLGGDQIHTWLTADGQGSPVLDETKVAEYVKGLAKTYNTAYQSKQLKTSYGKTVTISGGNYGWRINQSEETAALTGILRSGEGQTREPVYSQKAANHGASDYGDTYVEINLTAQHLFFYKNGSLVVQSDFVSGNESKGWSTPAGAYPLTYKQRDATLKGEGYATPVSYWMPFNGGIGMHDAPWRGTFGGAIYKTGGSHGCVNLPPAVAKTIYENISAGIPVLCYHLDGTQGKAAAAAPETETTAAGTTAAETTAAETTAAGAQPTVPEPSRGAASQETQPSSSAASETPGQSETAPAPISPIETRPAQTETSPAEEGTSGPGQSTGPDGAATKKDSGAVSGPGM